MPWITLKDKEKYLKKWRVLGHIPVTYCHSDFHCIECSKCELELMDDRYLYSVEECKKK